MAVGRKLYETKDRDESHRKLEEVLRDGKHTLAECREDPNAELPYQVWSGPVDRDAELAGVLAEADARANTPVTSEARLNEDDRKLLIDVLERLKAATNG